MRSPRPAAVLGLALLLSAAPRCGAELIVRVHLLPRPLWQSGDLDHDAFLSRGDVAFYRAGRLVPEVEVELNRTVVLPRGEWDWVAAGPDGVGWERGNLPVSRALADGGPIDKKLLRPALPACRLTVDGAPPGPVAYLSLTARAVFPLPGGDGWVPAGEGLLATRDGDGRLRFGRPRRCSPGRRLRTPPPTGPLRLPVPVLSARP